MRTLSGQDWGILLDKRKEKETQEKIPIKPKPYIQKGSPKFKSPIPQVYYQIITAKVTVWKQENE